MTDATSQQYFQAFITFIVASVGMMLGNKLAVRALPLPCVLVLIQVFATIALLRVAQAVAPASTKLEPLRLAILKKWLPIAVLFSLMIFTSLESLAYASVTFIIIFRNIASLMTTLIDYVTRGISVNAEIVASEVLILVGAAVYGWNSVEFTWVGFCWTLFNISCQVLYGVLLKWEMDRNPHFRTMTKYTMSYYNNVLAVPLMLLVLFYQKEHTTALLVLGGITARGWGAIAATCVMGFLISTSGFGLARLVSATAFLVVNNLAKFLNIVLGVVLLGDTMNNNMEFLGCLLAFGGGFWFSWASMKFNEKKAKVQQKQ